jgi:hypothetical protein
LRSDVDRVCINQADVRERNPQIQLMGEIYSHSHAVFVWLGPPRDEIGMALYALKEIYNTLLETGCA